MNDDHEIPSYEQAIQALYDEDDDTVADALFAFDPDDDYYVDRVKDAVRALLKREDLTPQQIVGIGRALHGLGRMPLRTPGLGVHISLSEKTENAATSYDVFVDSDRFATESGGYEDSGYGSDSFSGQTFAVENNVREYEGWSSATESWPSVFSEMVHAGLTVEDFSDDERLDWEHPDGSIFWKWIEEYEETDD